MIIIIQPGLWLIGMFLFAGMAFIFGLVAIQARSERHDLTKPEEEWSRFLGQMLSRGDFVLYRILPTASWTTAEFLLEDEQGNRLGSYLSQSRVRADLELRGTTYQMYIQRSGAFASEWAGKVGGTTDSTIVVRSTEQLITELSLIRKFPAWSYAFVADGRRYSVVGGGLLPTKPLVISTATEQVSTYLRPSIASRKILLALRRDLPDSALLAIMVAALLQ
jgi:hypothetical protein